MTGNKSYVSIEQKVCPVCGITHDSGAILLDRRLKDSMNPNTITGYELCEEHQKLFNDGFLALVECSNTNVDKTLTNKNAVRTENIMHIKRPLVQHVFNIDIPSDLPMVFVGIGVIEKLQNMMESAE